MVPALDNVQKALTSKSAHGETGDARSLAAACAALDEITKPLAEILMDLDHKVVTAEGGRAGLAKLAGGDFDLVFTDLAMPEMDGWETAREIRKQRPELPVVLITGYGASVKPPSGELDLVDEIICKPFDFDQVADTLAKLCNHSEAHA